ncbi:MAG: DUF1501 domain-containing protein [candidate division KSB1 bacterium]|nr:DUF1501 domain-containing protein [candidate division KSB1 bacterium]MDZ7366686.1 DUF1501 domain-containing protein [candidate division KSB1 bacterium]MDZ7404696.1 DUF1501 domain-containing protein [candidate division KSB1 bacterium]
MNRRDFIQVMMPLAGMPVVWPMWSFAKPLMGSGKSKYPTNFPNDGRVLVLVQMAGGNDGLNTIVPFGHDAYYTARPQLAIPKDQVIKLNNEVGFHPGLKPLQPMFDSGAFSIVHGVGYPNPDRSHFRSTDIWLTGSGSEDVASTGWLGRYFDLLCPPGEECGTYGPPAIQIGLTSSLALLGREQKGIALQNPLQFYELVQRQGSGHNPTPKPTPTTPAGKELEFLRDTAASAFEFAGDIVKAYDSKNNLVQYPNESLAAQLQIVARMIAGGLSTRVYIVSIRGFDTHAGQLGVHQALLDEMATSITAFYQDLAALGVADRVVGLCFSEFGRRVKENASLGTDHGTSAPIFMFGKPIVGGIHGNQPSLTDLENGDLKMVFDYRQIYASVLEQWLLGDSAKILGGSFNTLPLINSTTKVEDRQNTAVPETYFLAQNYPNPFNPQTTISFGLPRRTHVQLVILNNLGQEIERLIDGEQPAGRHTISWSANGHASGMYFYRLRAGSFEETKRMSLVR